MKTKNDTLNAIQTMVDSAVSKAGYDKTRNAVILARNTNNTYKIKMDGIEYDNVVCYGGYTPIISQIVKVVIPNNQASQMYILPLNGDLNIDGDAYVNGDINISENLYVSQNAKIEQDIEINGTLKDAKMLTDIITNTHSRTTATKGQYTGVSVTIPANSVYIIQGHHGDGVGGTHQTLVNFSNSGSNYIALQLSGGQYYNSSGATFDISQIVKTTTSDITVSMTYYNYVSTSHTITTKITAYRLR